MHSVLNWIVHNLRLLSDIELTGSRAEELSLEVCSRPQRRLRLIRYMFWKVQLRIQGRREMKLWGTKALMQLSD